MPQSPGPNHRTKQRPARALLEFCCDRSDDVLRFTAVTAIWPTHTLSARGVRPFTTLPKISVLLTSVDITHHPLHIRPYIHTPPTPPTHPIHVLHHLILPPPSPPPPHAFSPSPQPHPPPSPHEHSSLGFPIVAEVGGNFGAKTSWQYAR